MAAEIAVTVRGIAAGGAGVADLPDGRVVFVHRTAPGERVMVRVERSKSRWAVASLCEVLEPSAERRVAPCALYDSCGGCQLQHLPYERQLEWKARFVEDALTRIGGLAGVPTPEVVASPAETHYRNRITFTLRRLPGGRIVAGFHALHRPSHVIDVHGECVLPRPPLLAAWQALRAAWGPGARLLPPGGRLRLTLRDDSGVVTLTVEGGASGWSAAPLADAVPAVAAIWHRAGDVGGHPGAKRPGPSAKRLGLGPAPRLLIGPKAAGSTAFVQVNPEVAAALVAHVLELTGPGGTAVDAYCGAGEYGRALAERGWDVTGIEVDPAACAAGREGAPARLVVLEGRVEDLLEEALPADLLIVNPPRAGLDPEVARVVGQSRPPRVIYVSCDPATLARDVAALSQAYALASIRCFDLFPQTAHVETVAVLEARGRS